MMRNVEFRRRFLRVLWRDLSVVWPILGGLVGFQLALGMVIGFVERWKWGDAAYFTFVTGMTIGYGDLVPTHILTRVIALVIGFVGILITGLVAALGVRALQEAMDNDAR